MFCMQKLESGRIYFQAHSKLMSNSMEAELCRVIGTVDSKATLSYVLLVGEGNFSYSASLAKQNAEENILKSEKIVILATDFKAGVIDDPLTLRNIKVIRDLGGVVFTSTDATTLEDAEFLWAKRFKIGRVIFNFPHVQRKKMHLGENRGLLRRFFISVSKLIPLERREDVDIKVSLCNGQSGVNEVESIPRRWADSWQIVDQAAHGGFVLVDVENFWTPAGKNYVNCGFRERIHTSFDARDAKTFTFVWRNPFSSPCGKEVIPQNWINELHPSNPFRTLVDELTKSNSGLVLELKGCSSNTSPFIDVWGHNLNITTLPSVCQQSRDQIDKILGDNSIKLLYNDSEFEVGYIKNNKVAVNLSQIVKLQLNIIDTRILFSKYCKLISMCEVSTGSLFPCVFSVDISFWICGSTLYSNESFIICCLEVYGLALESVELIEVYKQSVETKIESTTTSLHDAPKKISHCYRISIRSLDVAISRSKSHELYLKLREDLQNKLGLQLRYICDEHCIGVSIWFEHNSFRRSIILVDHDQKLTRITIMCIKLYDKKNHEYYLTQLACETSRKAPNQVGEESALVRGF